MILDIYLIGVAIAFCGLMTYHGLKDKRMRHWPSDILFTIVLASVSWITVIVSIISIRIAIREFKARKNQENRNANSGKRTMKRHPEISQKQFNRNEILKPIKSSELQKSIESFSEN